MVTELSLLHGSAAAAASSAAVDGGVVVRRGALMIRSTSGTEEAVSPGTNHKRNNYSWTKSLIPIERVILGKLFVI